MSVCVWDKGVFVMDSVLLYTTHLSSKSLPLSAPETVGKKKRKGRRVNETQAEVV